MNIVVTGGDGFIGSNLRVALREAGFANVTSVDRSTSPHDLRAALTTSDFVFHLAGVNRPKDPAEFDRGNRKFTVEMCEILKAAGRRASLAFTSSTQASLDNPYGLSKRAAEHAVKQYGTETGARVYNFRLTNVFGKWCRPNYNSVVATFCYNILHGLPITVSSADSPLRLVYIDDVVAAMIQPLRDATRLPGDVEVVPVYETTIGAVASELQRFASERSSGFVPATGVGLTRALFATFASYMSPAEFVYPLVRHSDVRGVFAEMVKTPDSGQVSFFTANPGVTRGGHYHHTKGEKFLVVKGDARFGFRHIITGQRHDIVVSGEESLVVETVPGWAHDVTNIGDGEMIVMLWASEIFDPTRPDTITAPIAG